MYRFPCHRYCEVINYVLFKDAKFVVIYYEAIYLFMRNKREEEKITVDERCQQIFGRLK